MEAGWNINRTCKKLARRRKEAKKTREHVKTNKNRENIHMWRKWSKTLDEIEINAQRTYGNSVRDFGKSRKSLVNTQWFPKGCVM